MIRSRSRPALPAMRGMVAVVTGGVSGIGRATALALRDEGAAVAVLDLTEPAEADGVLYVRADVTDTDSVETAVGAVIGELGGIDVLVNNAGIGAQGTVADNPDDEWHRVLDVNVVGMARTTRAVLPYLRRSSHAAIVNICSIAATAGLPQRVLYSASKGAVYSMTLAMAADHLREGIRVNCVNPGTVDTPWISRLLAHTDDPDAELAALESRQPHGRLVRADEVAAAIVYLASPAAGSTTGTAVAVDGGMSGVRLRIDVP